MVVESCYDCESLNVSYRFLRTEDKDIFEAVCRDCGASWETDEDLDAS